MATTLNADGPNANLIAETLHDLGGTATTPQIREATGLSRSTLTDNLRAMTTGGRLQRAEERPGKVLWTLLPDWNKTTPVRGEQETVYALLHDAPDWASGGDPWTSTGELSDKTGLTLAVVKQVLAALRNAGRVEYRRDDDRAIDLWRADVHATLAAQDTTAEEQAPNPEPATSGTAASSPAAVPADLPPFGPDTDERWTPEPQAADDPAPVSPAPPSGGVTDVADWMSQVRPVSAPPATGPDPASGSKRGGAHGTTAYRRGALTDRILAMLRERPGEAFTVSPVAKALNAHTGSTAYAMDKLVDQGALILVATGPKQYRAES